MYFFLAFFNFEFLFKIKGLFEATTILHDEAHASVHAEKMKIFWLCCKNKFLFLSLI